MLSPVTACLLAIAGSFVVSLFASPRALRSFAAWLLAQACAVEYLYEEIPPLLARVRCLRAGELAFYREQLELQEPKPVAREEVAA